MTSTKHKRMKPLLAWACVGSHRKIFVTELSPHEACVGRLEVYDTRVDALRNDSRVIRVKITEVSE